MLKLYLNRWTISVIIVVIGIVLYFIGYKTTALIGTPIILSFIAMNATYKNTKSLSFAFLSGLLVGLAVLVNIYALIAVLPLLIYLYGPLRANNVKLMFSFFFGVLTPLWIYLPLYLYYNQETIVQAMYSFDISELFGM